jgi:fatty acid-binding protein DegV
MAQEYDIKVIPMNVVIDSKGYAETEIDRAEICARIREKDNSLITSSIPPGIYLKTWHELRRNQNWICSESIRGGLS